jgi:hypothetical protein
MGPLPTVEALAEKSKSEEEGGAHVARRKREESVCNPKYVPKEGSLTITS